MFADTPHGPTDTVEMPADAAYSSRPAPARLDPAYRSAALRSLADGVVDVLVVGGGVTGAGIALDAATRGLSVGLVEQRDFAAGTSSRSSKLIHGGLRYLEQFDFRLVREALHERSLLMTTLAPHLVSPLPFLFPLLHRVWERAYIGSGVTLYDVLAGINPSVPRHSHLSKTAALKLAPSLKDDAIIGALRYHDAQVDDARHTLEVVRTAATHGARVVAGARVVDFLHDGDRVSGVRVRDMAADEEIEIRARVVALAGGVWTTALETMAGVPDPVTVRASKGVHILVPKDRIDSRTAIVLRTESSVLFVLPWGAHWIIGTTDTAWQFAPDHPAANHADVAYLLEQTNRVLRDPLTEADVTAVYAGLRPLVDKEGLSESQLSREHVVRRPLPGLVSVAGGKYTTYRVMAADTVDAAAPDLVAHPDGDFPPSVTATVPLVGALTREEARERAAAHPAAALLEPQALDRIAHRYGALAVELLDEISAEPALAQPLPGGAGYLAAEVLHACRYEGALLVDDVLTRRTRMSIEATDRGLAAAPEVARIMGEALGWDDAHREAEVDRYRRRLAAERAAQAAPDDAAADAARTEVVDPRVR